MKKLKCLGAIFIAFTILFTFCFTALAATEEELDQLYQIMIEKEEELASAQTRFDEAQSVISEAEIALNDADAALAAAQAKYDAASEEDKPALEAAVTAASDYLSQCQGAFSSAEAEYIDAEAALFAAQAAFDEAQANYNAASEGSSESSQEESSSSKEENPSKRSSEENNDSPDYVVEQYVPTRSVISMIYPEGAIIRSSSSEGSSELTSGSESESSRSGRSSTAPRSSAVNKTGKRFVTWGVIFIILAVLSLFAFIYFAFLREKLKNIMADDDDDDNNMDAMRRIPVQNSRQYSYYDQGRPSDRPVQSRTPEPPYQNAGQPNIRPQGHQIQKDYFGIPDIYYQNNADVQSPPHNDTFEDINIYARPSSQSSDHPIPNNDDDGFDPDSLKDYFDNFK